jgi:hypothetical protein
LELHISNKCPLEVVKGLLEEDFGGGFVPSKITLE